MLFHMSNSLTCYNSHSANLSNTAFISLRRNIVATLGRPSRITSIQFRIAETKCQSAHEQEIPSRTDCKYTYAFCNLIARGIKNITTNIARRDGKSIKALSRHIRGKKLQSSTTTTGFVNGKSESVFRNIFLSPRIRRFPRSSSSGLSGKKKNPPSPLSPMSARTRFNSNAL